MTNANAAELMTLCDGFLGVKFDTKLAKDAQTIARTLKDMLAGQAALPVNVDVCRMAESSGRITYYVQLSRPGQDRMMDGLSVYSSASKGRMDYHADELRHLFGQGPKPDILAYNPDIPEDQKRFAPAPTTPAQVPGDIAEIERRNAECAALNSQRFLQEGSDAWHAIKDRATLLAYIRTRSEPSGDDVERVVAAIRAHDWKHSGMQLTRSNYEGVARAAITAISTRSEAADHTESQWKPMADASVDLLSLAKAAASRLGESCYQVVFDGADFVVVKYSNPAPAKPEEFFVLPRTRTRT